MTFESLAPVDLLQRAQRTEDRAVGAAAPNKAAQSISDLAPPVRSNPCETGALARYLGQVAFARFTHGAWGAGCEIRPRADWRAHARRDSRLAVGAGCLQQKGSQQKRCIMRRGRTLYLEARSTCCARRGTRDIQQNGAQYRGTPQTGFAAEVLHSHAASVSLSSRAVLQSHDPTRRCLEGLARAPLFLRRPSDRGGVSGDQGNATTLMCPIKCLTPTPPAQKTPSPTPQRASGRGKVSPWTSRLSVPSPDWWLAPLGQTRLIGPCWSRSRAAIGHFI